MKQYLDLLRKILSASAEMTETVRRPRRITTCALAEIMGIPEVAVKAIAKDAGMELGEWIDVNSLSVFEDAYIRKLRAYFKRMMRNANAMGYEDLRIFIDFCKTFKKPDIIAEKICRWEHLDEDAIREQFQSEVEERSQEKPYGRTLGIFGAISKDLASRIRIEETSLDSPHESSDITNHNAQQQCCRRSVLRAVTSSLAYRTRLRICSTKRREGKEQRAFFVTAHYYIYCREDKEDHHVDTIFERSPFWAELSINSTLVAA